LRGGGGVGEERGFMGLNVPDGLAASAAGMGGEVVLADRPGVYGAPVLGVESWYLAGRSSQVVGLGGSAGSGRVGGVVVAAAGSSGVCDAGVSLAGSGGSGGSGGLAAGGGLSAGPAGLMGSAGVVGGVDGCRWFWGVGGFG
jgi:hypothetical protein